MRSIFFSYKLSWNKNYVWMKQSWTSLQNSSSLLLDFKGVQKVNSILEEVKILSITTQECYLLQLSSKFELEFMKFMWSMAQFENPCEWPLENKAYPTTLFYHDSLMKLERRSFRENISRHARIDYSTCEYKMLAWLVLKEDNLSLFIFLIFLKNRASLSFNKNKIDYFYVT